MRLGEIHCRNYFGVPRSRFRVRKMGKQYIYEIHNLTKKYGQLFLNSVPKCPLEIV